MIQGLNVQIWESGMAMRPADGRNPAKTQANAQTSKEKVAQAKATEARKNEIAIWKKDLSDRAKSIKALLDQATKQFTAIKDKPHKSPKALREALEEAFDTGTKAAAEIDAIVNATGSKCDVTKAKIEAVRSKATKAIDTFVTAQSTKSKSSSQPAAKTNATISKPQMADCPIEVPANVIQFGSMISLLAAMTAWLKLIDKLKPK
jgi:RNA polymerase-binding transcription factor DksA